MGCFSTKTGSWHCEHKGIIFLAIGSLLLIFYFLFPFLDGLVVGTVFAYVGRPIRDLFRNRKHTGSIVATVCIIIPIFAIMGLGMTEIANQIIWLAHNHSQITADLSALTAGLRLPSPVQDLISRNLSNAAEVITSFAAGVQIFNIGKNISLLIINLLISIPVCYFLLLDGEQFVESIMALLPEDEIEVYRKYLVRIDRILSGVFLGSIYTAIVGGLISAFVFYIFDLPRPFALASLVFIAGLVPILTAWIIIIPATIYKYITLGPMDALMFLLVSSALIYLPTELAIRPYLVSSKSSIHPLLVMLSFFGGALVAGIGGFFLAPALVGVVVGIYQIRSEERAEIVS